MVKLKLINWKFEKSNYKYLIDSDLIKSGMNLVLNI